MAKKTAPQGRVAPKPAAPTTTPQPRTQPRAATPGQSRPIQHKATGSTKQQITEMNNPKPVAKSRPFKVVATRLGYYDHVRRREGDVFIVDAEHFADAELPGGWMERVDALTPERTTTAPQALKQEHDRILGGKVTGGNNPLDAE